MTRLLTAREVADQLGISTETTLRWVRRGQLPAFRLPSGQLRFRETDLANWLQTHATAMERSHLHVIEGGGTHA